LREDVTCPPKTVPILNGYLNIKEAAEILGIHPETFKRLYREKKAELVI
jgi:hypothetical protein